MNFNFEEWAELARQDQVAFEKKRTADLRETIEQSAHSDGARRRLNGLQFRVDMIRRRHRHALGACIDISNLMLSYFYQLASLNIEQIRRQVTDSPPQRCRLIPFRPVRSKSRQPDR